MRQSIRKILAATVTVTAATMSLACGASVNSRTAEPEPISVPSALPIIAPRVVPSATDFTISVKIMEKKCFGSAGCRITYRIAPSYDRDPSLLSGEYTVLYEITGGEDGPQINNFTVDSVSFRFPRQETISTSSSKDTLTARAVDVLKY